jgi:hypothetical protein
VASKFIDKVAKLKGSTGLHPVPLTPAYANPACRSYSIGLI